MATKTCEICLDVFEVHPDWLEATICEDCDEEIMSVDDGDEDKDDDEDDSTDDED